MMGGAVGALAGGGMLLLIVLLVGAFCREMGWLKEKRMGRLLKCLASVMGACIVYRLAGALMHFVTYGPTGDVTEYHIIFLTRELTEMYRALNAPFFPGLLRGVFVYAAHGLGKVLFDQYLLAGEVLAFACVFSGTALIQARLDGLIGEKGADQAGFLALCLPVSVFLFLPGWGPVAYVLFALAFFILGRWLPRREYALPEPGYGLLLALSSVLAAVMVYCLVTGRLM